MKNAGKFRHNMELIQKLHLHPRTYRRKIDENPFHGLTLCGMYLKATGVNLVWTSKTFLGMNMWYKLKKDLNGISDEEYEKLGLLWERIIACRPQNLTQAGLNALLGDLCKSLWLVIMTQCGKIVQPTADKLVRGEEYRIVEVLKTNKFKKKLSLGTSKMFLEMLFYNQEEMQQVGFAHYLRDVYEQLDVETRLAFRKRFASFIDDQLFKLASPAVVYPFRSLAQPVLILPFAGGTQAKYAEAGYDLRRRIKIIYSYLFEQRFGAKCNDRLLDAALVEASTFLGAWNFEAYVEEIGGNRVVDLLYALYAAHVDVGLIPHGM